MKLKYHCLICSKFEEHELEFMSKKRLFLNFDNDCEHRPICVDCREMIENLLHYHTYCGYDRYKERIKKGEKKQFRSKKKSLFDFI